MRIGKSGLLLLLIGVHSFGDAEEGKVDLLIPDELARCMDQVRSENDEIKLIYGNPFYLRGDFDGDDRVDYVAEVRSGEPKPEPCPECRGVLFCFGSGATDVLGAKMGPLPDGVDPEDFGGPTWKVVTATDPEVEPLGADGEVVQMIWEDAGASLYLENSRYKWKWAWGKNLETGSGEGE